MKDTPIDNDTPIGAPLRIIGGNDPWYKTKLVVADVQPNILTFKWVWWKEAWFRISVIVGIVGLIGYLV